MKSATLGGEQLSRGSDELLATTGGASSAGESDVSPRRLNVIG